MAAERESSDEEPIAAARGWRMGVRVAVGLAAVVFAGCAPKQPVPLDVGPPPVEVYLDGERVPEPLPVQLELRSDRAHVVFVKKAGHRSEQVVLRSVEQAQGAPRLEPDRIEIDLRRETPKGRRLEVELDDPPPLPGGTATEP